MEPVQKLKPCLCSKPENVFVRLNVYMRMDYELTDIAINWQELQNMLAA